jgi:flagellar assembly protein FliH
MKSFLDLTPSANDMPSESDTFSPENAWSAFTPDNFGENKVQPREDFSATENKASSIRPRGAVIKASQNQLPDVKPVFEQIIIKQANDLPQWQPSDLGGFMTPSQTDVELQESEKALLNLRNQIEENRQELDQQASALLVQAQAEADKIRAQARQEIEALHQQALVDAEAARQQGWEAGYAKATQEVQEEATQALATAAEIVRAVKEWRLSALPACEGQVVEIVREIARVIFGEGVALDGEALQIYFNRLLEHAQNFGDLKVFTHPTDAAQLDSSWRQVQFSLRGSQIQIIPSENVKRGGCYIDGQMGVLDARIETQLNAVLQAIDEEERSSLVPALQTNPMDSDDAGEAF